MIVDDKRIARVFPRKTKATPTDDLAFTGPPVEMFKYLMFTYIGALHRAEKNYPRL